MRNFGDEKNIVEGTYLTWPTLSHDFLLYILRHVAHVRGAGW